MTDATDSFDNPYAGFTLDSGILTWIAGGTNNSGSAGSFVRRTGESYASNHWSEITFVGANANDGYPTVKHSDSNNHYFLYPNGSAVQLWKRVASSYTSLSSNTSVSLPAGTVLRLEINGTTLTGYVNGVSTVTATDSSLTTGGPGFSTGNSLTAGGLETWSGGDTGSSATATETFDTMPTGWTVVTGGVAVNGTRILNSIMGMKRIAESFGNDHYSEIVCTNANPTGHCAVVRYTDNSNYYYLYPDGAGNVQIWKNVAGSFSAVGTNVAATQGAGSTFRLDIVGTTLSAIINGVTVDTHTDSSLATGVPAIVAFNSANIESWLGGPIAGGGGGAVPVFRNHYRGMQTR